MSNIGKKPIEIKEGMNIKKEAGKIIVSGPKGTLETKIPAGIDVILEENMIRVKKIEENKDLNEYFGLTRALLANAVQGVSQGFEKKLELTGVGFRVKIEGDSLVLNVGYTVPVRIKAPEGINFRVEDNNIITISGINKELVGNTASMIRKIRVPDPYKGKGIRYAGERIRRKVGKAAKTVGGK